MNHKQTLHDEHGESLLAENHTHHDHDEHCGCTLHERHDHDEDCGCSHDDHHDDHDHNHDHDHEHGHNHGKHDHHDHADCGCHDHHDHDHGHDHHGHNHGAPEYLFEEHSDGLHLTIMEHGEALVASLKLDLFGELQQVGESISASLSEFVKELETAGAMIGHVKAALSLMTPLMTFDSVGGALETKERSADSYCLELAAIVFFISQDELVLFAQNVSKRLA